MRKRVFLFNIILTFSFFFAQNKDSLELENIIIWEKLPVTSEKITEKEINIKNAGKDLPNLLENQTSVISTSDAGNAIGYTALRIRGADQSRINVTLNGIPLNDSESQNVFWVNTPNLSGSLSSISIQRGVGTSTNGSASFGASVAMNIEKPAEKTDIDFETSAGSFGTTKYNFNFNSGEVCKGLTTQFSISKIYSKGYIDRAFSDLFSYQFQANYNRNKSEFTLFYFNGKEETYQAWYGIDNATMNQNRTYNFAGAITDENGNIVEFYDNQTDNYQQKHYQLHWKYMMNERWKLFSIFHYTKGKGYYEEYENQENLQDYGIETSVQTDLIRRKWLDNDFVGLTFQTVGKVNRFNFHFGWAANQYIGNHFGRLMNAKEIEVPENWEYYKSRSEKNELSGFAKTIYTINRAEIYTDLQWRWIDYFAREKLHNDQEGIINFSKNYLFLNPKFGINYYFKNGKIYGSYALAQREPTRTDILENNQIKPEKLHDIELGVQQNNSKWKWESNVFAMFYQNQLVLTGMLDNVGNPIRENTNSYRLGWENSLKYKWNDFVQLNTNFILSINRNRNYYAENQYYGNTQIAFSPNYIHNLTLTIFPIKNMEISIANKYVSQQYLTNYQAEDSTLKNYFQTDIYCNYAVNFTKKLHPKFFMNIYNALNSNIISNGYYYLQPYYYPQAKIHFLTGFSINF